MKRDHKHIFEPSGCLTREAFSGLVNESLPPGIKQAAEAHLESCPFCSDALEGFRSSQPIADFAVMMAETDKSLSKKLSKKNESRINTIWLAISIAASVLLLIGLFYMLQRPQPKIQIAQQITRDTASLEMKGQKEKIKVPEPIEKKEQENPVSVSQPKTSPKKLPKKDESHSAYALHDEVPAIPQTQESEEAIVMDHLGAPAPATTIPGPKNLSEPSAAQQDNNKRSALAFSKNKREESLQLKKASFKTGKKTIESKEDKEEVLSFVEEMPQYPGGNEEMSKFLASNLKYPSFTQETSIPGRVIVQFIVGKDGNLSQFKILHSSSNSDFDNEVIRVLKLMPHWKPGKQNGEKVAVFFTLPVLINLKE